MNRLEIDRARSRARNHDHPGGLTEHQWKFLSGLRYTAWQVIDGHQFEMARVLKKQGLVTLRRRKAHKAVLAKVGITQRGFDLAKGAKK